MIEGINIRCDIGPVQIMRSPYIQLVYRRRAVVSRATVTVPDPEGTVRAPLSVGQSVTLRFGYRGEELFWHEWEGTVEGIDQPLARDETADAVTVRAVGLEKALTTTLVTESFYREPADAVARRLLARTGLAVGAVDVPADILPYQVFSTVPVARAIKQLDMTLNRAFGHDLSKHALWLSASGLTWSAEDEPGPVYSIATAENLIDHTPPATSGGTGVITSVALPGLVHSRRVHIRDVRRGVYDTVRALDVVHTLRPEGNTTEVGYGKDLGWAQ